MSSTKFIYMHHQAFGMIMSLHIKTASMRNGRIGWFPGMNVVLSIYMVGAETILEA